MLTPKKCQKCGAQYMGGPLGRYCLACRKKISSEGASRRRLWDYGAKGRWGEKDAERPPQWVGPSAELQPEEVD